MDMSKEPAWEPAQVDRLGLAELTLALKDGALVLKPREGGFSAQAPDEATTSEGCLHSCF